MRDRPVPLVRLHGPDLLDLGACSIPMPYSSASRAGRIKFLIACLLLVFSGCRGEQPLHFIPGDEVRSLPSELQEQVNTLVIEHAGTVLSPKLLGAKTQDSERLKLGQNVYHRRCVQCHGVSGDGAGPLASTLSPRPRDYRPGIFKFTSTPYGEKPRREDLVRTVTVGIPGTSMPRFDLLPVREIEAVVDYVLMLTHRGELERLLAVEATVAGKVDRDAAPEMIAEILNSWDQAEVRIVNPMTPRPDFTEGHVLAGREAFLTRGCAKCHGEDGRGQTVENLRGDLKDAWGNSIRAADLTSGMLHGGREPEEIYRRIYSGINGTPMPGFSSALAGKPEEFWNLVAYVRHLAEKRP